MKNRKKGRWAALNRASFTVEAALLMPMILMVTLVMIYLSWHIYDRAFLTAYACEAALTGKERDLPALPALEDISKHLEVSETSRRATCSAKGIYVSGETLLEISVEEKYAIVKPLKDLRIAHALKKAADG